MVTQEDVIIEQTQVDQISSISSKVVILQDTDDNVIYLTRKMKKYEK